MMTRHPSTPRLRAFAAGTLPSSPRGRVAAHLERCTACRGVVADMRALPAALVRATEAAPRPATWDAIAARVSAGEAVLLPEADAAPRRPHRRAALVRAAVVAAVLLAGGTTVLRSARSAEAAASELAFFPAAPTAGQEVRVVYRPGSLLEGADRLVLRGRFTAANTIHSFPVAVTELGTLRREGDVYTARFTLPDTIVYAVFAVENGDGTRVDHNGQAWELMVHDAAGRPLPGALTERIQNVQSRDTREMRATAERMTRLYPDRADGWMWLYYIQASDGTQAAGDSVRAAHRQNARLLSGRLRARAGLSAEDVRPLLVYASAVDDSATLREWRGWMERRAPSDPVVAQLRATEALRGGGPAALERLEQVWAAPGGAVDPVSLNGYLYSVRTGDDAGILRWGDRLARSRPIFNTVLARTAGRRPSLRDAAMDRARLALRYYDESAASLRDLASTRPEYARVMRDGRGAFLGMLGRGLVESGRTRAGLDTLSLAAASTWNPAVFRGAAQARLALGDTAGALPLLARLAADPSSPAAFADSARVSLGARYDAAAWAREVAAGRRELRARVMETSVDRAVHGDLRLRALDGAERRFEAKSDSVTLVAFWSRWCMPSREQLPELERTAAELRRRGARVITVVHDEPVAELERFLADEKVAFPVYLDPENDTRRALQSQGTPYYVLLDTQGRIRFIESSVEDLLAEAEALRDEAADPSSTKALPFLTEVTEDARRSRRKN